VPNYDVYASGVCLPTDAVIVATATSTHFADAACRALNANRTTFLMRENQMGGVDFFVPQEGKEGALAILQQAGL
jgi:hypothetical protein